MAWNGSGAYVLPPAYSPEVNGTVIDAVRYNGLTSDVAAGITNTLSKDGQNVPTANLPMGGFKHTGAAAPATTGDYLVFGSPATIGALQAGTILASSLATTGNISASANSPVISINRANKNSGQTSLTFNGGTSSFAWQLYQQVSSDDLNIFGSQIGTNALVIASTTGRISAPFGLATGGVLTAGYTYTGYGSLLGIGGEASAAGYGLRLLNSTQQSAISVTPAVGVAQGGTISTDAGPMRFTGASFNFNAVVTATGFVGPLTGAVTGNVTGNISGSSGSTTGNAATATNVAWSGVTGTPTTKAGYGITDVPTVTGGGASGSWGINITGSSASCTGNSVTATTATSATTATNSTSATNLQPSGASATGLTATSDGRVYGAALHNNAGSVTGTSTQYIASGTYTPTLTAVTGFSASTAYKGIWNRVGNVVTVTGSCLATTASGASEFRVSLPIASPNLTLRDLAGTYGAIDTQMFAVNGEAVGKQAQFTGQCTSTGAKTMTWCFSYEIL